MKQGIGIVKTQYGLIQGEVLPEPFEGITAFRGIPYAAPPIGELRWRPPVNPTSWTGVRNCRKYGPRAIQSIENNPGDVEPYITDFYYGCRPETSEDCLYLNVTTGAQSPNEKRPVLVWFHGGYLRHGYSYEIEFDNSVLASKGIIVVTVGQRLNIMGHMALPQLTAEQGSSGNWGLMDEIKAFDWVYENIAAFGGDPDNITVGGQSGGTEKSAALAFAPQTRGKIRRMINQSDLKWIVKYPTMAEAEALCQQYLESQGIDPQTPLETLRSMNPFAFMPKPDPKTGKCARVYGEMVFDNIYVEYADMRRSMERAGKDLDILSGMNQGERRFLGGPHVTDIIYTSKKDFLQYCHQEIPDLYEKYDFESLVDVTDDNVEEVSRRLAVMGLTTGKGIGGIMLNRYFGEYRTRKAPGKNTFTYLFSRVLPIREEDKGTVRDSKRLMAFHSSELWYMFASLRKGVPPSRPWAEWDFKLADMMSSYWANFIHTGDPNGEGLPYWPKSDETYGYIEFGNEIKSYIGLDSEMEHLIMEFVKTRVNVPECELIL